MTREQAKAELVKLGIEEPTDAQVSNYLNTLNSEVNNAKTADDALKQKAAEADELQKKLDELQNQGLSEVEQLTKALEQAKEETAKLKSSSFRAEAKAILRKSKAELDDEDIEAVLDGLVADTSENTAKRANAYVSMLDKSIEKSAKAQKQQNLKDTKTPDGDKGDEGDTEKTEAEKTAEMLVSSMGDGKDSADIISNYV